MVPFGQIDNGFTVTYNLKKEGNGVYAFILSGQLNIDGQGIRNSRWFWNLIQIPLISKGTDDDHLWKS
jgi:hypothetical protein